MKNAYLLLTDLHYNSRKDHRINYLAEVLGTMEQVLAIEQKYRADGYNTILVFLGDVVDGPITNAEEAMRCQDLLTFFCKQFKGVYAVVGNHEENNNVNNPFWFLVSSIQDTSLSELPRPLQPQGISPCIEIVDKISDGDVTFWFNHYGIPAKVPAVGEGVVNIGLFHQNVGSNDICQMWGTFDNVEEAAFVRPYNYCFFGHMHLAEGKYYIDAEKRCLCEWLGSCVGTNVNEVEQQNRQCSLPVVLVEDGALVSIAPEKFNRSVPKDVIDYRQLEITRSSNELLREVRTGVSVVSAGDSLYERVCNSASLANLSPLAELLVQPYDHLRHEYKLGLEQIFVKEDNEDGRVVGDVAE